MAMRRSSVNLRVSAADGADLLAAATDAKGLATRLHVTVALDYLGSTYFIYANSDLDEIVQRHAQHVAATRASLGEDR
jgi:hypothetical protein